MVGTIVNTAAIIVGSGIGLLIKKRFPERVSEIVFQGLGLFTIFLGLNLAWRSDSYLLIVSSLVLGSIIGELLNLEKATEKFAEALKTKFAKSDSKFTEGFITATLLYCVGSMAIIGAIEDGLKNDPTLLFTKSLMDGFSAIILSAAFGLGVIFSSLTVFTYQATITLMAGYLQTVFTETMIADLSAVGGLLILGLAVNILELKKLRVLNMLPSLLVMVVLSFFFH